MIGAEEFLGLVALAELVHVIQMFGPSVPIRGKWELLTAITADVGYARMGCGGVEGRVHARERSARPRVTPKMERILVPFGLVLVLEPVGAELASVLLFQLVDSVRCRQPALRAKGGGGVSDANLP